MPRTGRREAPSAQATVARIVLLAAWVINAALLVVLLDETYQYSVDATSSISHGDPAWVDNIRALFGVEGAEPAHGSQPVEHDLGVAVAFTGSLVALAVVFFVARRILRRGAPAPGPARAQAPPRRAGFWVPLALWITVAVLSLGVATYYPCVPSGGSWVVLPGWVLGLFGADVEWLGPASTCALAFAPGFELARSLALVVTTIAAGGLVWVFARNTLDGVRARLAGDVDLVVGLDDTTMPLVRVLVARNQERERPRQWVSTRPGFAGGQSPRDVDRPGYWWWWLTGLRPGDLRRVLKRRPRVVVVEPDGTKGLVGEARALGALVVIGEPTRSALMRGLVSRPVPHRRRRRVTLRRLYSVTPSLELNKVVYDTVAAVLDTGEQEQWLPHLEDRVPRLLVRFDDARDARQWRLDRLRDWSTTHASRTTTRPDQKASDSPLPPDPRYISDCVSTDILAAELVADQMTKSGGDVFPEEVVIIGESALGLTLLEELAWRQWYQIETSGFVDSPDRVSRVILAGPHAAERAEEWRALRAPWRLPPATQGEPLPTVAPELFLVDVDDDVNAEGAASRVLSRNPDSVVVFVDDKETYAAAASRLARLHRHARQPNVFLRTPMEQALLAADAGVPFRFAPGLVRVHLSGVHVGPGDMATRAAELHHAVYLASLPKDTGTRAGSAADAPQRGAANLTARPWGQLPAFYQEDNVRQLWSVLAFFTLRGFEWVTVSHDDQPPSELMEEWERLVPQAAEEEYKRWARFRRRHGWWAAEPVVDTAGRQRPFKHDGYRMHSELRGYESSDQRKNVDMVEQVLRRMWALGFGLRPVDGITRGPVTQSPGASRV